MKLLPAVAFMGAVSQPNNRTWWTRRLVLAVVILAIFTQALYIYHDMDRRTIIGSVDIDLDYDLNVTWVDPDAEAVGFQMGDQIVSLNDEPVSKVRAYRHAIDLLDAGSLVYLKVQRGSQSVLLNPIEVQNVSLEPIFIVRNLTGLALLLIATWVVLARPEKQSARFFFWASLVLGLYVATIGAKTEPFVYLQDALLTLAPALAIHFFLIFPRKRRLATSRWWVLLYLPSLVLMAFTLGAYYDALQAGYGLYHAPRHRFWNATVDATYLSFSAIFGLVMIGHAYTTTPKSSEKRQLQWIMLGLAAAALVAAVDVVLTLFESHTDLSDSVLTLAFLVLPFSFALAILRYRLWDLDVVLSRSAVYGLLTAGLAAIYLMLISVISTALGGTLSGSGYPFVLFISALVVGLMFNPARAWLQDFIDRAFFRQQMDYQHALARWSEELSTSLRFSVLANLLLDEVPSHLLIREAWLLVLNDDESRLEALVHQGFQAGDTDPPEAAEVADDAVEEQIDPSALSIQVRSPATTNLARPGKVLLLYGDGDQADAAGAHGDLLLVGWRQAGVRLVLPLLSGEKLVGVYLLGEKLSGDVYQRQELELLRTLTNQAAVAITNARLYEEIHAFSQELEVKVQERTKELRDFLSVVCHELSTPITAVRGYTALLLDGKAGPLNAKQARYLSTTRGSVGRLMRLVGDLSDVSRIEDGRLTVRPEPLDLQKVVAEAVSNLTDIIDEKGLQVTVSMPAEECIVRGDPQRVAQILINLLSNACRYTPAGGQIQIAASRTNGSVAIKVSDTGVGIQPDDLERIFERFYRSPDPFVQEQSGTGLGLSITKSLVELHGSRLQVESVVGQGSTFSFKLKLAAPGGGGA